jgi:ribonuclease R
LSAPSSPRVVGTLAIHPRGFGFFEPDMADADASCYVAPADLAPFLADDRVEAEIATDARGRRSAKELRLVERTRTTLFGEVAERDGRPILVVDRQIASGDWPLEPEGGKKGKLPKPGTLVVAEIRGDQASVTRVVSAADASLERVVVARHALRVRVPRRGARAREGSPRRLRAAHRPSRPDGDPHRHDRRPLLTRDHRRRPRRRCPPAPDGALRLLVSIADVDSDGPGRFRDSTRGARARRRACTSPAR